MRIYTFNVKKFIFICEKPLEKGLYIILYAEKCKVSRHFDAFAFFICFMLGLYKGNNYNTQRQAVLMPGPPSDSCEMS